MSTAKDKNLSVGAELRRRAEEQLRMKVPELHAGRNEDAAQRLVHEVEVHQIELEMQNAELKRVQEEMELSRNKYLELYDFAPVCYFTFDRQGLILEVNFAGAGLLGVERGFLINKSFTSFIADADGRRIFSKHIEAVLQEKNKHACEIKLKKKDGALIHGEFQSTTVDIAGHRGESVFSAIIDGTVARQLGEALRQANDKLEATVKERTAELIESNLHLSKEIEEHERSEEALRIALAEVFALQEQLEAENIYFRQEDKRKHRFENIIGQNEGLKSVLFRAEQVAPTNTTVLVLGETGTGKELIAAAIHNMSPRKERPLITVNCAALPGNLIESELFGREKGAFTGADSRQVGRFEIAHRSSLCLDEIGELPLELQAKLLRVIQYGEFERLGSSRTIKVDVRIIATTNRDLEEEVRKGSFRQDLFYRLNVFPITVPPLRQRKDDIPFMVEAFIDRYSRKLGKKVTTVRKKTMKTLQDYPWPGNVRELESIIERSIIMSPGPVLQLADRLENAPSPSWPSTMRTLEEAERSQILQILSETQWHIEGKDGAAAILDIHPSTLRARMHKLGIVRPQVKE